MTAQLTWQLPVATRTLLPTWVTSYQGKFEPGSRQEARVKDWACTPVCAWSYPCFYLLLLDRWWNASEVLGIRSIFIRHKSKKTLTCYFPPHPRTHEEPYEEGEEQRHAEGGECYRPDGEDQAQHWQIKVRAGSSMDTERSDLISAHFPFPIFKTKLMKLSTKKYATPFGVENSGFKMHHTL